MKARNRKVRHVPRSHYRADNDYSDPEDLPQYFQVSINILEARKLIWSNAQYPDSYIVVVLGKKKFRTNIKKGMEDPFFREAFVFELYMSIRDMRRSSIWLAVMEPRWCAAPRLMGEASIDLGAIWSQPHHQVHHKWAQLSLPRDPSAGCVGFVKLDISIIFRGEVLTLPSVTSTMKLEDNLILPSGSEQQSANYIITVHGAFGLPDGSQPGNADRRLFKSPSTYVRVTFCGLVAKTAVQHRTNNPTYNEQISMVEMFPNMNQMIRLEVCSAEGIYNKVLAGTDLRLGQMSHDGENGYLPTFGPSLLQMYGTSCVSTLGPTGEDGPFHRGSLLVSLRTVVPYYQQGLKTVSVEPISPINYENLWSQEEFCILCPIMEVSMLDRRVVSKNCGIAITIGDLPCDKIIDADFESAMTEIKNLKLHYTGSLNVEKTRLPYGCLEFPSSYPVLQLATRLPDFRYRMFRNNIVCGIVEMLEMSLTETERRLQHYEYNNIRELVDELNKAVDDTTGSVLKYLDIVQYSGITDKNDDPSSLFSTELDRKQLALQRDEMVKVYQNIRSRKANSTWCLVQENMSLNACNTAIRRKHVKELLADTKKIARSIRNAVYSENYGWPDVVLWILNNGSRVAYCKIPTADIIYSVLPEQCGRYCGQIQTLYMKPIKCPKHISTLATGCYCIVGKIELLMWMGLYRQKNAFDGFLPVGYNIARNNLNMRIKCEAMLLEFRAFILRAKIVNNNGNSEKFHPFIRINALSTVLESKLQHNTTTPEWNQLLKIQKMHYISEDRLFNNPPMALVEVCNAEINGKPDLIGRLEVQPVIDERQSYEFAPKLQWYDLYKGTEYTGQVLMSVQLVEVQEKVMRSTIFNPPEDILYAAQIQDNVNDAESLPLHLIPKSQTYKIDIYWWGLRDINTTRKPCVVLEIDDLILRSDIICDKKINSNFPNGRMSQIFECPLNDRHTPPLKFRLYDSSTFGRTLFLGNKTVKNPNKYIVNWLPKSEREASLKSVSMMSANFNQVNINQVIVNFQPNSVKDHDFAETLSNISAKSSFVPRVKTVWWKRLFYKREPNEEEFSLLPVYEKEMNHFKVLKRTLDLIEYKNWWLRYACSQEEVINDEDSAKRDRLIIYKSELELQPEFSKFKDWCASLKLYNGKKSGIPEKDNRIQCGLLKAAIAIYRWPPPENTIAVSLNGVNLNRGYFDDYPSNGPIRFLVRVYVVKGINLMAKDFTGKIDPYVVISCGRKHLGDRNKYIPNSIDPIFGKMYEFRCTLPDDYQLTISLYDYDAIPPDELIGHTTIDLEDRIYTKHRARVGLAPEYSTNGPIRWRDCSRPSAILEELCSSSHIPPPSFPDLASVVLNAVEYRDSGQGKQYVTVSQRRENLCLNLLQNWHTMPLCGYHLVPEHVETRTLYHPDKPGVEQGQIQMWVDIFPLDSSNAIPPPTDIDPRKTDEYEVRLIIWDVYTNLDCPGVMKNVWKVNNIYVRSWIGKSDHAQDTDVHRNTMNGEGHFNWRMVFHIFYQHSRQKMIVKEICPFTEFEEYCNPLLVVQVMESDTDDLFGSVSLNLNSIQRGSRQAQYCFQEPADETNNVNLFQLGSVRAWWPLKLVEVNSGHVLPVGVIDLEVTLLPKEKAVLMPVGLGRDPPCPLPHPKREAEKSENTVVKCITALFDTKSTIILVVVIVASIAITFMYLMCVFCPVVRRLLRSVRDTEMNCRPHTANGTEQRITSIEIHSNQ